MPAQRAKTLLLPAVVLVAALAVRLEPWGEVYGSGRPTLVGDWDPHYHVLRAERWLTSAPGAPWRDPNLDWPFGAEVPWPPLFDALIAGVARAVHGSVVERGAIVSAAAPIPVALGLALVVLAAALGARLLGKGRGWIAALLVAVLPLGSLETRLGRVDQHSLEVVLFCGILLAFAAAVGPARRGREGAIALAVLVPLAFWSWMGSALDLFAPLLAAAAGWAFLPERDRGVRSGLAALAGGGLGGAAVLAATVLAFGRPGALASGATTGVGGLQVAMAAAAGAFALLLLLAPRLRNGPAGLARRLGELALAASIPAAALLSVPALRDGIAGGLTALLAANPWYARIREFFPLLDFGRAPLFEVVATPLFVVGLAPVAAILGLSPIVRAWRAEPERRPALLLLAASLALFVPGWFFRRRLGMYAVVPLAIAAEAGLRHVVAAAARRFSILASPRRERALLVALCLATIAPTAPKHLVFLTQEPVLTVEEESAFRWLASQPIERGREAVLAPWWLGHAIQFFSDRPVVTSPFGTEGGPGAMEDEAEFWFAADEAEADSILARRRCGYVLLSNVGPESLTMHGFAPVGTAKAFEMHPDLVRGMSYSATEQFERIVPARLFFDTGAARASQRALGGFRLVYETTRGVPEGSLQDPGWTIFQPVAGARVDVVGAAGSIVQASTEILTNTRRRARWRDLAPAKNGGAALRLPYATGYNGAVLAREWTITDGPHGAKVVVQEADVLLGRRITVDLAAGRVAR